MGDVLAEDPRALNKNDRNPNAAAIAVVVAVVASFAVLVVVAMVVAEPLMLFLQKILKCYHYWRWYELSMNNFAAIH